MVSHPEIRPIVGQIGMFDHPSVFNLHNADERHDHPFGTARSRISPVQRAVKNGVVAKPTLMAALRRLNCSPPSPFSAIFLFFRNIALIHEGAIFERQNALRSRTKNYHMEIYCRIACRIRYKKRIDRACVILYAWYTAAPILAVLFVVRPGHGKADQNGGDPDRFCG